MVNVKSKQYKKKWMEKQKRRSVKVISVDRKRLHPDGNKKCTKCEIVKVFADFNNDSQAVDGLKSSCRGCIKVIKANTGIKLRSRTKQQVMAIIVKKYGHDWKNKKKLCGKCKVRRKLSKYSIAKSEHYGMRHTCMKCNRDSGLKFNRKIFNYRTAMKTNIKCHRCQWMGPAIAFDFAHIDRKTKKRKRNGKTVSPNKIRSIAALDNEVKKCDKVCGNCHGLCFQYQIQNYHFRIHYHWIRYHRCWMTSSFLFQIYHLPNLTLLDRNRMRRHRRFLFRFRRGLPFWLLQGDVFR